LVIEDVMLKWWSLQIKSFNWTEFSIFIQLQHYNHHRHRNRHHCYPTWQSVQRSSFLLIIGLTEIFHVFFPSVLSGNSGIVEIHARWRKVMGYAVNERVSLSGCKAE